MTSLPWMDFAEGEIGQKEIPGRGSNPRIIEYRRMAGIDIDGDDSDVPWCKIFVNAAFKQAGLPIQPNAMALSIRHDPNFEQLDGPTYGCVIAYWRGSPSSGTGHTGFYVGQNSAGTRIYTLGGNESDQVEKAFYPTDSAHFGLVGYWWPKSVPIPEDGGIVVVNDDGSPAASAV